MALILLVEIYLVRNDILNYFAHDGLIQGPLAQYLAEPGTRRAAPRVEAAPRAKGLLERLRRKILSGELRSGDSLSTESVLMEEPDAVSDTIRRVARLGVSFSLDDFGTGYSSLAYLTRLPIDALKVDRSFVEALGIDARSTAITTAIVRMAQALSAEVVAEGVETERQLDALRALDCDYAQGFLFHRPLPAHAIGELLDQAGARDGQSFDHRGRT